MNPLEACRMCLSVDARMLVIADTPLQAVYENITRTPLQSNGKPVMACYICHGMLKKSRTFIEKSLRADGLLQQILDSGMEITPTSISEIDSTSLKPSLVTRTECTFVGSPEPEVNVRDELIEIKIEAAENDTEEATEEYYRPDVKEEPDDSESECEPSQAITGGSGMSRELQTYGQRDFHNEWDEGNDETDSKTPLRMFSNSSTNSEAANEFPRTFTESDESKYLIPRVHEETNSSDLSDSITDSQDIRRNRRGDGKLAKAAFQKCDHCEVVLKSAELQDHIKLVHSKVSATDNKSSPLQKQFPCNICEKSFSYKYNLDIHIRTHTGEKPHRCNECGKAFNQKQHLQSHMKTHSGEKPFSCAQCEKAFNRKGDLKSHIRRHSGVKPFRCNQCDRAFSQRPHLNDHIRTHTGERPYVCNMCDKAFSKNSTLKVHFKTHSAEKPFSCDQCDKTFSQSTHLKDHMRTHTGERPHTCHLCDKAFSKKHTLKIHYKTHSAEKPFHCELCDKWFGHKAVLRRHVRRMHTQ